MALISGFISVKSNAAMILVLNTNVIFFMIPLGISFASVTIVGNYIGKR